MKDGCSQKGKRRYMGKVIDSILKIKALLVASLGARGSKAGTSCACKPTFKDAQPSIFQEVRLQNQESASINKDWVEEGIYVNPSETGYRLPDEWVSPSGPKPPTHAAPVIRQ